MTMPSVSRQAYSLLTRKDAADDGRGVLSVVRAYLLPLLSTQEPEVADGFRTILRKHATAEGPIVERDGAIWLKVCELGEAEGGTPSGHVVADIPNPKRLGASVRAMILSDSMGAYDLLAYQLELWGTSAAGRGADSRLALASLRERLSGARDLEALHGPGCLLQTRHPFLRTLVDCDYLEIPAANLQAAEDMGRNHPGVLRAWTERALDARTA